jgi:hypothetical protein
MDRTRRVAILLTLVFAGVFVLSLALMARRIGHFNEHKHFLRLHVEPTVSRLFQKGQFPLVSIIDYTDPEGNFFLRLDYGGKTTLIPAKRPPAKDLPNLAGFDEWCKVLAMNEVELGPDGGSIAKPGTERLIIVNRRTPDGFDPDTWGSVRRAEWVFDFYDLKLDGTIDYSVRRWPRSYRGEETLKKLATATPPDDRAAALFKVQPLQERTVEYFAALHVIPRLNVPRYKFTDTAFSPGVLGWTLPASMSSVLFGTVAFGFAVFSRRKTRVGTPGAGGAAA